MKLSNILRLALLTFTLALSSCRSHKVAEVDSQPVVTNPIQDELLSKVDSHTQRKATFVGSKMKFSVTVGDQQLSLTGNLRMKRNDVIRLQLLAFGFVEAARLEFTKDYVLILDKYNRQYLKAP